LSLLSIALLASWTDWRKTSDARSFGTAPNKGGSFPLRILEPRALNTTQSNCLSLPKPRPTKQWQSTTANDHSGRGPAHPSAMLPSVKIHPAKLQPPPQLRPLRLHQQEHLRHPARTPALRN